MFWIDVRFPIKLSFENKFNPVQQCFPLLQVEIKIRMFRPLPL